MKPHISNLLRRERRDEQTTADTILYYINGPGMMFDDAGSFWNDIGEFTLVHDLRFTPARGAWYKSSDIKIRRTDGKRVLAVPVQYKGCCMFGVEDASYVELKKVLLKELTQSKMDYTAVMTEAAALRPSEVRAAQPEEAIRHRREMLSRVHGTVRGITTTTTINMHVLCSNIF